MKTMLPLIAAAALALAACGPDADTLLSRARTEFAAHDFKAAQLDLATVLKERAGDPAVLELHARTALALGDGETARASLAKLPANKRPADLALLLGEAALLRQDAKGAEAAVAANQSAEAWRVRAMAALLRGDAAEAEAAFVKGESAPGPQARLLADHARQRLHGGDLAGAQALAGQALKADPGSLDAGLVEARLATAQGDLGRAVALYDGVSKAWPGNLAALTGKAAVLGDLGRITEMKAVLAQAANAGVSDGDLVWLQARAAAAESKWADARDLLQANADKLAGRPEATLLRAQVLVKLGQGEQARALLQPLLTRDPANAAVRRALAGAALAARDPAGAVEALRPLAASPTASSADLRLLADAARQAGASDAAALLARARFPTPQELARTMADADAAMKARNWGNAIAAYERIMAATDGTNAIVLNNLAYAQDQVGNKAVALGYAMRALRQAPNNPTVMDTAGWLLVQTGKDRDRGVTLLRAASAGAPGNITIRQHLAAAQQS
jgi:tetratricopeptide (TPR) repeat protein